MNVTPAAPGYYFPLTAFAGYAVARRALLCLLIDPTLRGALLSGPVGSGKSALMRSFGAFARTHVDPSMPFVQVPAGVGEERLIGGIDLDAALATGERRGARGLIAEADGGILYVDDLPLLEGGGLTAMTDALETGRVVCEREGVSMRNPAHFVLIGTALPAEREIPFRLADRVAFLLSQDRRIGVDQARMLVRRLENYRADPASVCDRHDEAERALAAQVVTARSFHGLISVGPVVIKQVISAAMMFGVAGNRADLLAAKAARAHAALRGSRVIEDADVKFAIATVLVPRSMSEGAESETVGEQDAPASRPMEQEGVARVDRNESGGEGAQREEASMREEEHDGPHGDARGDASVGAEHVEDPLEFNAPLPEMDRFFPGVRRSESSGHHGDRDQWLRGRHTRSLARPPQGKRIALGATLRAAAPHQRSRRGGGERREGEPRVVVRAEDLRVKKFNERAGTLYIFCVDASGSMASNRMREAKGAVTQLLEEAYVNRDTVALIAFRGSDAEVLLPPTSSVERAKRSLDVLPTGGGTPLAAALMKAFGMVLSERRKGSERALVILLTDGRANVPIVENAAGMIMEIRRRHVREELETIAVAFRREGVGTLVIDTRQTYGEGSEAVRLAESLAARYYYLPKIDAVGLALAVRRSSGR